MQRRVKASPGLAAGPTSVAWEANGCDLESTHYAELHRSGVEVYSLDGDFVMQRVLPEHALADPTVAATTTLLDEGYVVIGSWAPFNDTLMADLAASHPPASPRIP